MSKIIFVVLSILLILATCLYFYTSQIDFFFLPEGHTFCVNKGYDSVSFGGSYSQKFGKVNCVSCYNGECRYEEFDVTKRFGIISEVKK